MEIRLSRKFILIVITVVFSAIFLQVVMTNRAYAVGGNMINVLQFGAKGNGQTDDTDAIQRALDQAASNGDTVFFPKGTYVVNPMKTLYVESHTGIVGEGKNSIIKASPAQFGWELVRATGEDIVISNIYLDGNNQVNRVLVIGGGSKRVNITGVKVSSATHSNQVNSDYYSGVVSGIVVLGNTTSIVIDKTEVSHVIAKNSVDDNLVARGIYVTTTWNSKEKAALQVSITNSYIHHIGPADDGDGIYYEDPNMDNNEGADTGSIIANNVFEHCAKRAIKIYAQGIIVKQNKIVNPYLDNNYYQGKNKGKLAFDMYSAISIYGSNNTVDGNSISGEGSYYAAIEIGAAEQVSNIKILNNSISMGQKSSIKGTTSIRLGDTINFTIASNQIENGEKGIWAWQNAEKGIIQDNILNLSKGGGIDLTTYVPNSIQKDITCSNNAVTANAYKIQLAKSNVNVKVIK